MLPDNLKNAFIAIEDERFYEHYGVDWKRTFTAFINEILHMWGRQGASTITQQLVKNVTGDADVNGRERSVKYSVPQRLKNTVRKLIFLKHTLTISDLAEVPRVSKLPRSNILERCI